MKLVIESTDAIFGRVLELLQPSVSPQRDWIEEQAMEPAVPETPPELAPTPVPLSTDTAGIPWDRRIHAETKAQNSNGTWRYRRGVDKALVATVEAEYKQAAAAPPPPPSVADVPPPPPVTFTDAMSFMAKQIASGKTTSEAVNAYCKSIGVPNLIAMSARPDLVPGFNDWLSKL